MAALWDLPLNGVIATAVMSLALVMSLITAVAITRRVWPLAVGVVVPVAAWLIVEKIWVPFPDHIPDQVYIATGAAVTIIMCALRGPWRRIQIPLAAVGLVCALLVANATYEVYPTISSFDFRPHARAMHYEDFRRSRTTPQGDGHPMGALVSVSIPATHGYKPRNAYVYVPPAYWQGKQLPVLMLLPGSPGSPKQWFSTGWVSAVADSYQRQHNGMAPIVISVDATGSLTAPGACVGGVEDYLVNAVPQFALSRLHANPDRSTWTIGGLSYGGTCALQMFARHPGSFGAVLDYSGEREPSLGTHQETVDRLFHGDARRFAAYNPADIFRSATRTHSTAYRRHYARFSAGKNDPTSIAALRSLSTQAGQLGIDTCFRIRPGGHTWEVWRAAIADDFAFTVDRSASDKGECS